MMKQAFTMIELIFVIVILGILAVIAIPKLMATRDDAKVGVLAQQVTTSATDIASYITSQGKVESDLTKMSGILETLKQEGAVTVDASEKKVVFKVNDNDCMTMRIVGDGNESNLTIVFNQQRDSLCEQLRHLVPEDKYPMRIKGRSVSY